MFAMLYNYTISLKSPPTRIHFKAKRIHMAGYITSTIWIRIVQPGTANIFVHFVYLRCNAKLFLDLDKGTNATYANKKI